MIDRRALTAAEISAQSTSSRWTSNTVGDWTNAANWSAGIAGTGGIRTAIFDYRDFAVNFPSGSSRAVVRDGDGIVVDRIDIAAAYNRQFYIESAADAADARITFVGDAVTGRASMAVIGNNRESGFLSSSASVLHIQLDADLVVNVGSSATFLADASFEGAHGILKQGSGTMILRQANTFGGNLEISAGTVQVEATDALSTGDLIMTGGVLSFRGITEAINNDLHTSGPYVEIIAEADADITLSGGFTTDTRELHLRGVAVGDSYNLTLDFESLDLDIFRTYLDGVKIGSAFVAANLFDPAIRNVFVKALDTNGYALNIADHNYYGAVYKSSNGALNLTFHSRDIQIKSRFVTYIGTSQNDTVGFLQDLPDKGLYLDLQDANFEGFTTGDNLSIQCTNFDDIIYLPRFFISSKLLTFDGNDRVYCKTGSDIALGAGSDFARGSGQSDNLFGGAGDDELLGNGGNDILNGGSGADRLVGGDGDDLYFVDNVGDFVTEGSTARSGIDEVRVFGIDYVMSDNIEIVRVRGGAGNVTGNALDNQIVGSNDANTLIGADGNDTLKGNAGSDVLNGGLGNDLLIGGAGRDMMTGGAGADRFAFNDPLETKPNRNFADVIRDFSQSDGDRIALSKIDANTTVAGDQAFTFIGTAAFGNHAGELRYTVEGASTFVEADLNGDGRVDLTIALDGNVTLVATDFIL